MGRESNTFTLVTVDPELGFRDANDAFLGAAAGWRVG